MYVNSFGFKSISTNSAFEPIIPPIKWAMADQAFKVSMIFFEYRIHAVLEMHNGENILIFTQRFWFSRLRPVGGAKTLPPSVAFPGIDYLSNQSPQPHTRGIYKISPTQGSLGGFNQISLGSKAHNAAKSCRITRKWSPNQQKYENRPGL